MIAKFASLLFPAAIFLQILSAHRLPEIKTSTNAAARENPLLLAHAKEILEDINSYHDLWHNRLALAMWQYQSNMTDDNLRDQMALSTEFAQSWGPKKAKMESFPWHMINDPNLKRQYKKFTGVDALPEEENAEYNEITNRMQHTFSTAKICDFANSSNCNLPLDPNVTERFTKSRNPEELKHLWKTWRDASGKKMRQDFVRYVELSKKSAVLNNYTDMAAVWIEDYESEDFAEDIKALWRQVKPLYLELHAYIRRALRLEYGERLVPRDQPIPGHLLGNMWAQNWINIADLAVPYPNQQLPDATEAMVRKGLNATSIFRIAENFFTSLNLSAMPETFWKNSILEKPSNVELICHPSAWDFSDGKDFRIRQCTRINMEDLLSAHHEMGHIQYYLQYKDQPMVFRRGANPGFQEAVGDTIALSASTPRHLHRIRLLQKPSVSPETLINHLYFKGLDKIVALPFVYAMEKWRWDVFKGRIHPDNYNCEFWKIVEEFQGIAPAVPRSEEDFDPGAKFHIAADAEMMRYFVSTIIEFQFHKALCIAAGEYDPRHPTGKSLSQCNIYGSAKAGDLLRSMMELGSSRPWQEAMERITGQRKMDASGLLEYFKPLYMWLIAENRKNGERIGWTGTSTSCT